MSKVSIVMPVFIFSPPQIYWFKQAVESIINQTYQDWELIIVDDGSMLEYKEHIPDDSRIKVFYKEHGGVAKARNLGISKMTGDFYTAQDADDSSDPTRIEKMVKALDNADVVFSDMYVSVVVGDKQYLAADMKVRKTGEFDSKRLAEEQYIPYFVMARANKMVKYRDKYTANDDWLFIIDLYLNGCKFVKINEPLMIYRRNPMSVSCRAMYDGRKIRELKWCKQDIKKIKDKL